MTRKRGYSRDFTPKRRTASKRYLLDDIPAPLWATAKRKARHQGVSMRALILRLLTNWSDDHATQ